MASGYGLGGGPSRCFPFWQEVLACYVVNTNSEDDSGKKKCGPVLEDYYEKEAAKVLALQHAYRRKEAETSRDNAPSAGDIRGLGLLDRNSEEVDIRKGPLPTLSDNAPRGQGDKPRVH
ncbi:hypothetical protein LTR37_008759 [Vermiconidia calcicola]|uniref:Uncharacterized protein n=1 Tax=Vermiconidia calcicola TaxID=1690605 RepID=A0ACC3NAL0_9PEZI|nr:hypothetical protein LTR37_008759 [Vermiconidia calcicola]